MCWKCLQVKEQTDEAFTTRWDFLNPHSEGDAGDELPGVPGDSLPPSPSER